LARLHRNIALAWEMEREFDKTLQEYETAEGILGDEPTGAAPEWRQEWVEIQLDRIQTYYWLNKVEEMGILTGQMKDMVAEYGLPDQRGKFFIDLALFGVRRDRYQNLTDETVSHAQTALAAQRETGNLAEIAFTQFGLGFIYLWQGELDKAIAEMQESLALCERVGDSTIRSRNLTYLTVIYRKLGDIEKVREYARRSLEVATAAQMLEYIGMAKANLAWAALREGNAAEAQQLGEEALALLQQVMQGSMFGWVARWPMLWVYLGNGQLSEAAEQGRAMLETTGQPLPETLAAMVQAAVSDWEGGDAEKARVHFMKASELAKQLGYL